MKKKILLTVALIACACLLAGCGLLPYAAMSGMQPDDTSAAAAQKAAPAVSGDDYTEEPITRMRKVIAENMRRSLAEMAQLTENTSFDATQILAFRKAAKAAEAMGLGGVTLNDVLLFAVSRTLLDFPDLNATFDGEKMRRYHTVHLGFACDTPKGLVVPVIRSAEKKTLAEISAETKRMAAAAQAGELPGSEMTGGSFTVSNLGSFGVEEFTPVINPPQTGILGVCKTVDRPRRASDGSIELFPAMGLSLTYDHRAIDGAPASRYVQELCKQLEQFTALLAK